MGGQGDGEMVSHCVARVPRVVASGATRRGRQGDKETRRQGDKETRRQGDKEMVGSASILLAGIPPH